MRFVLAIALMGATGLTHALEHQSWDQLLDQHVSWSEDGHASVVNYEGFDANRGKLKDYLEQLSSVDKGAYEAWSDDRQLAFLINAYNAFTVELILRHYPDIDSIRDIGNIFSGPWDKDFFRLLGEKRTLDELEHNMIRVWFNEPRIHFAVNCASVGCPALRPEAFTGEHLEQQLADSTRRFLGDRQRNRVDASDDRVHVSPLFKWYEDDFANGDVKAYLASHASRLADTEEQRQLLKRGGFTIAHTEYDWNLNVRENLQ
jgi:hypothetical protein